MNQEQTNTIIDTLVEISEKLDKALKEIKEIKEDVSFNKDYDIPKITKAIETIENMISRQ